MHVVCHGPLRGNSLIWQPRAGAYVLTVACYATFELAHGVSAIVARPLDHQAEGEDDERWLVEPWGPVAPVKPHAEVVVVGNAYAPEGFKVTSLLARLAIGDREKLVRVHGESYFTEDGSLFGPEPFTRMPLGWSRAAGGPQTANPSGIRTGSEAVADAAGRVYLPNLRAAGASMVRPNQLLEPTGFGPLAPNAPARRRCLFDHAGAWNAATWSEWPLPGDVDHAYFNVAPRDQLLDELTGTERIVLENLHPRLPQIVTYVRAPPPGAWVSVHGLEQSVPMHRDTLVIDADRGLAIVVWRGSVHLDAPPETGVVILTAASTGSDTSPTAGYRVQKYAKPLPFRPAPPDFSASAVTPTYEDELTHETGRKDTQTLLLPNRSSGHNPRSTQTLSAAKTPRPALPFSRAALLMEDTADTEPPTLRLKVEATSSVPPPPLDAEKLDASGPTNVVEKVDASRPTNVMEPHESSGPTPVVDAPGPRSVPPTPVMKPRVSEAAPPLDPLPEPPTQKPAAPRPTVATSIEYCATIAGRIAQRPTDADAILEKEDLTKETWESHHARWQSDIQAEVKRGKRKLLVAYDAAYVEALEASRGSAITVDEYARLSMAVEPGDAKAKLDEMHLPEEAMPRIRRVWLTKLIKDPRIAAAVQSATRAATEE